MTVPGPIQDRTTALSRVITLVAVIVPFVGVASAMNLLWGVALRPIDLVVLAGMYLVCGVGITVGFHRLFSHRSFKAGPVVRATFGILNAT